jgi:hypothetical protein
MAFNQIQFQHGMSIPEFLQCFGTEAQCAEETGATPYTATCGTAKGSVMKQFYGSIELDEI